MKKHNIVLMILMLILCTGLCITTAYAETTEDGNFEYTESENSITIDKYIGTAERVTVPAEINGKPVKAIGQAAFERCETITAVELPEGLESIGAIAFSYCTGLKGIELPDSVKILGEGAFLECTSLDDVDLGNGLQTIGTIAFAQCSGLTSIEIPESVTTINEKAFINCQDLQDVKLPAKIATIEDSTFNSCKSLTKIKLPEGLETIGAGAFNGCEKLEAIELPDSVSELGDSAFAYCEGLKEVKFSPALKKLGYLAFDGCKSLTEIKLPDSVETMGGYCFRDCTTLASFDMSMGVRDIGEYAFKNCTGLKEVYFSPVVEKVGNCAFSGCDALTDIYIRDSETYDAIQFGTAPSNPWDIKGAAAYRYTEEEGSITITKYMGSTSEVTVPEYIEGKPVKAIERDAFAGRSNMKRINLPYGLESIGDNAFYNCGNLSSIEIPDSVTNIGSSAFTACHFLEEVKLPAGIEKIKSNTFYSCIGLKRVVLPECLKSIEGYAFYKCDNLSEVYFSPALESVGENAFYGCGLSDVYMCEGTDPQFEREADDPRKMEGVTVHLRQNLAKAEFHGLHFIYDGAEHTVVPVCEGLHREDFTYDELKVKDAGKYKITVKAANPKMCCGNRTLEVRVSRKELDAGDVSVSGIKKLTYTGKALKQSPMIRLGELKLTAGTDYKLYYDKNTKVGTATMDIVFKGNYSGAIENLKFTIKPATASLYRLTSGTKKLTVKMSTKPSAKGATKYQLAYKQKGTSKWKYTSTSYQTKTIKYLKKGKRYYVKARACKTVNLKKYYGAWSSTKLSSTIK